MANITENTANPAWSAGIYQIETSDPVLGGANGIANRQAKELAARTQWLKTEIARAVSLIGTNQNTASQQFALKTTQINAGAGLTGGGVLRDNTTISMGTPSKITATSQNSAVSNTHTHEIDKASTSVAGIVRLSSATDSTAENLAATPKAIKQLADLIGATGSASFPQRGALGGRNLNDLKGTENYGVWHQSGNAAALTTLNYPIQEAGTLLVMPSAYAGLQLYIPYASNMLYLRYIINSSTTTWRIFGDVVDALNSDKTTSALSAKQGKVLAERLDKAYIYQDMRGTIPNSSPPVVYQDATPAQLPMGIHQGLSNKANLNGGGHGVMAVVKLWHDSSGSHTIYREGRLPNGEIWRQYANHDLNTWQERVRVDGADWQNLRDKPNTFTGYGLTGNQTFNGKLTSTERISINAGDVLSFQQWPNCLQFSGQHAAITLRGRYAMAFHGDGRLYLFDNDQRAYGLTYNYAAKSLNVVGEITSGSHHLTRKADRATTLSGYGITDGVTPTQLQTAVAGIVSSSPAALDTLRELAAALGNDPNYAATTARKLGEAAPSGTVAWFAGSTAPTGWLKANGAAVSRTTYAALFAAIGTTYGAGDGRTTFNLPDLRGEFVRGWDDGRQVDSARALGSRQSDALQQHSHELPSDTNLLTASRGGAIGHGGANTRNTHSRPLGNVTGARTAAETRPRNIALLGIIKI